MSININNHVFKGHKALLGGRFVTYGEVELPTRYELFAKSSDGFDWGTAGGASVQLAFSMLYQLSSQEVAQKYAVAFTSDVVSRFSRDWIISANTVLEWIDANCEIQKPEQEPVVMKKLQPIRRAKKTKSNIVKDVCKELHITQKYLAQILEVPEGTVSSWAVKNEIPRLGKKAIEFYIMNEKNQKIVDSYRSFKNLLEAS